MSKRSNSTTSFHTMTQLLQPSSGMDGNHGSTTRITWTAQSRNVRFWTTTVRTPMDSVTWECTNACLSSLILTKTSLKVTMRKFAFNAPMDLTPLPRTTSMSFSSPSTRRTWDNWLKVRWTSKLCTPRLFLLSRLKPLTLLSGSLWLFLLQWW